MFTTVAHQNSVPQLPRTTFSGHSDQAPSVKSATKTNSRTNGKSAGSFLMTLLRALGAFAV